MRPVACPACIDPTLHNAVIPAFRLDYAPLADVYPNMIGVAIPTPEHEISGDKLHPGDRLAHAPQVVAVPLAGYETLVL